MTQGTERGQMIMFRLPPGVRTYDPVGKLEELREEFTKLYHDGFIEEHAVAAGMRVPVVGESVTFRDRTPEFQVHYVQHVYDPPQHAYVVLR